MRFSYFILLLGLMLNGSVFAQKIPDGGRYKVHVDRPDMTVEAEILPVRPPAKPDPAKWYFWFGSSTIHQTQGGFSGHLLDGLFRSSYEDGSIRESGTFSAGLKEGIWRSWNSDGTLRQLLTYRQGVRDGHFVVYQPDGSVLQSGQYDRDLLDGAIRSYPQQDSVKTVWYDHGKVVEQRALWKRVNVFKKHARDTTKQVRH